MRHWVRVIPVAAALLAALSATGGVRALPPPPQPWPQFHHDEAHTGVAEGVSNVVRGAGPLLRWQYRVTAAPEVAEFTDPGSSVRYRWTSTLPLADLDGDGKLEVIVTTPDGTDDADRVIALRDRPAWSCCPLDRPGRSRRSGRSHIRTSWTRPSRR